MASTRLYYTDPARLTFDALVQRCEPAPASHPGAFAVWLSESAFYPTSGGQPFDTGRLGDARVVDVFEDDAGEVVHVVDWPLERRRAGRRRGRRRRAASITGSSTAASTCSPPRSCAPRRSATVSFHLGSTVSTIDLAREVTPAEIAAAEDAANAVILEHRPVTIRFVSGEEAAALPLRKEPKRGGELRIIDIADWDVSACGGTHVAHTGEIGPIAVRGWERFKGGTRLEFVCGGRTLAAFRELRDTVTAASRLLSVLPHELSAAIGRVQEEARDLRRSQRDLQAELAGFRAGALAASAETIGAQRAVLASVPGADGNALKALAVAIVAQPGLAVGARERRAAGDRGGRPQQRRRPGRLDAVQDAGRPLRRQGRRASGPGAGRRTRCAGRRHPRRGARRARRRIARAG